MEYDFWDEQETDEELESMNTSAEDPINEWYYEQMQDLSICFPSEA